MRPTEREFHNAFLMDPTIQVALWPNRNSICLPNTPRIDFITSGMAKVHGMLCRRPRALSRLVRSWTWASDLRSGVLIWTFRTHLATFVDHNGMENVATVAMLLISMCPCSPAMNVVTAIPCLAAFTIREVALPVFEASPLLYCNTQEFAS